jgi:RNA polymerase sigma-70 factor (ECF subfamily)
LFNENTDQELLKRSSRGDEAAFEALYERRQGAIFRFAYHMSGSREVAEDVTQETFVTLARNPDAYASQRGAVTAFLHGVARNLVLRRLERDRALTALEEDGGLELPVEDSSPLGGLLRSETVEAVRRAVLALPESYREAVVLCDLEELSYEQAAESLGCPVGTVRSKLNRGRALLAERLRTAKGCFA